MNGKLVKVKQYNLEFGVKDRFVNVLGCFKYQNNGNVYVVYSDVDTKYNIIYYGSGHLKESTILCMPCREAREVEVIKEYIFKVINNGDLSNFINLTLDDVEDIEIISSNKIEVKPEILTSLIEKVIPKQEENTEEVLEPKPKKKLRSKFLIILLFLIILIGGGLYLFLTINLKDDTIKSITCNKSYKHNELVADVYEENTYNFDNNDKLKTIDTSIVYKFDENNYQDFILKGTYYKYMPSSKNEGNWDKDDNEYTFYVMYKEVIDTSYNKPTNYEEALFYYKSSGFTCKESIKHE